MGSRVSRAGWHEELGVGGVSMASSWGAAAQEMEKGVCAGVSDPIKGAGVGRNTETHGANKASR